MRLCIANYHLHLIADVLYRASVAQGTQVFANDIFLLLSELGEVARSLDAFSIDEAIDALVAKGRIGPVEHQNERDTARQVIFAALGLGQWPLFSTSTNGIVDVSSAYLQRRIWQD